MLAKSKNLETPSQTLPTFLKKSWTKNFTGKTNDFPYKNLGEIKMKKYIALKAVKFDRNYAAGEEIAKNVIAPQMISKLIRCGKIATVEVEEQEEITSNQEQPEGQTEQEEQINQEEQYHNKEKELLQYKKEELEHMAETMEIEVKQGMTKAEIFALLLQKDMM